MTGHTWQQQAVLARLDSIVQHCIQPRQQQSDKAALTVIRQGGMLSRRPYYDLPPEASPSVMTPLLQKPSKLHDMEVTHIAPEYGVLELWLAKGGEIRGKLNGIGFAKTLNMEVDSAQHLAVRDVSLQGSCLALPGASQESMSAEIKQEPEVFDNGRHQQHSTFSKQQKCLFIHSDRLGRIEASLQDVGAQVRQA